MRGEQVITHDILSQRVHFLLHFSSPFSLSLAPERSSFGRRGASNYPFCTPSFLREHPTHFGQNRIKRKRKNKEKEHAQLPGKQKKEGEWKKRKVRRAEFFRMQRSVSLVILYSFIFTFVPSSGENLSAQAGHRMPDSVRVLIAES